MFRTRIKIFIIGMVLIFSSALAFAQESATIVSRANKLYRQGKFDEALKLYYDAQIKNPDASEIDYNIGAAQYKKGDYKAAISSFEKATVTKDRALEAKANYNIGNAKYRMGKLKENTDLGSTVALFREALDYYKRAIQLNTKDEDAKLNHELVEKELKALLDKFKQQEEQQKQQKQQAQEKEQQQKGIQQEAQKQEQPEPQKSEAKEKGSEQKEEKQALEAEGTPSEEQAREMSQQEAKMLLEGEREEENAFGKINDRRRSSQAEVLKDW